MPTDLETQLGRLGDELRRTSDPITVDEIAGSSSLDTRTYRQRSWRRTLPRVAAMVGAAAAVLGLVVIANRPGAEPVASSPGTAVLPEPMAPGGSLVLGQDLAGWQLRSAADGRRAAGSDVFVRRIYATDTARPEEGASLIVDSFDVDAGSPDLDVSTGSVTVRGADGFLFDREPDGRGLAFELDGFWYSLTSYNLTDQQLLTAAESVGRAVDGYGATINPSGLPEGLVDEVAGIEAESWFVSRSALDASTPSSRWENGASSIWLESLYQDPSIDRFQRIGAATVVDTTVNDRPAFLRTLPGNDQYRSITWHVDGRTNVLGSVDVSQADLIEFAEALRPATRTEWRAALAAVAPPVACLGADCTERREPGSIVPSLVEVFPAIDDALVPDDGRGATFAQYTYFPEDSGPIWTGVIGVPAVDVYDDLITVTVSAARDAEAVPVEPGRSSDVGEYDFGSGVTLVRNTADGTAVVVQGRDIDQLYEVLEHIAPTSSGGSLSGYSVSGELPDGLVELEAPIKRSFDDGSFPFLMVHGGVLGIDVRPGPVLHNVSGWIGPFEQLTVEDRPALLNVSALNDWAFVAIQLEDGNTLTLAGAGLDRRQLIDLAESIELVDQHTWNDRYDPIPAVIPFAATETMVEVAQDE